MNNICTLVLAALLLSFYTTEAQKKSDCGISCYSTSIVAIEESGDCYRYTLQVSYDGSCPFELSHYDIGMGCGTFSDASNSMDWKMEINHTDPTTGLTGLKVDDIQGFGKDPGFVSFEVVFTFCPDQDCPADVECIVPQTAYKAGQCVYYEEVQVDCEAVMPLSVDVQKRDLLCAGDADGSIALEIAGGVAPYRVQWNTGAAGPELHDLPAGVYVYTVFDQEGQSITGEVNISAPPVLSVSGVVTHPVCGTTLPAGSIDITAEGGAGPYTYAWSTGTYDEDPGALSEGSYRVVVTDSQGCTAEETFILRTKTDLQVAADIVHPSCDGSRQGSITLDITGGTEPYTVSWSGTSQSGTGITGLEAGYYRATITDVNGCQVVRTYALKTEIDIELSINKTDVPCTGDSGGTIDLEITGGEGPYIISWSDGYDAEDRTGLEPGRYDVTVTDERGCTVEDYTYIRQEEVLVYPVAQSDPSCAGDADGSIQVKVYNGTGPYDYSWSDGTAGESRTGLSGGSYTVTVTDANGCIAERTINLVDPDPIAISYEVVPPGCDGQTGYDIEVQASGGTGGLSYLWSAGQTTASLYNVASGTYTVTVTDENGCMSAAEIVAEGGTQSYDCLITAPVSNPTCGSVGNVLDATQAGVLTYNWQIVSTDNSWSIEGAADGSQISYTAGATGSTATFYLEVTFENGCSASCELAMATCNETGGEDPGDGEEPTDPGEEDPPSDGCTDCFDASPVTVTREGDLFHYTITVGTSEPCRHDLSHVVISVPECASVTSYSNSMGWKMEATHTDPTSGVYGIKVDDIPAFGKEQGPSTFDVSFSLTSSDPECLAALACYYPLLAYKAAQCISYAQSTGDCADIQMVENVSVYPNPAEDLAYIGTDDLSLGQRYIVEVFNSYGFLVLRGALEPGTQKLALDLSGHTPGLYIVRITDQAGESVQHKIIKQ